MLLHEPFMNVQEISLFVFYATCCNFSKRTMYQIFRGISVFTFFLNKWCILILILILSPS